MSSTPAFTVPFAKPQDFLGKLVKKENLNAHTISLWFEPVDFELNYLAGQFVMVKFADPADNTKILTRSYSIASAPNKNNQFELCVGIIPEGLGSNYLASLSLNDEVEFKGPFGMCSIKPDNLNNLVMVATGTGIAPVKAILEDLASKNDSRDIDVLFGVRHFEDLFYLNELKQLADKLEGSNIMLTLSKPNESWTGHHGRVTDHLPDLDLSQNPDFYICGNGDMIKDVRNWILSMGIDKKKIHVEIFN